MKNIEKYFSILRIFGLLALVILAKLSGWYDEPSVYSQKTFACIFIAVLLIIFFSFIYFSKRKKNNPFKKIIQAGLQILWFSIFTTLFIIYSTNVLNKYLPKKSSKNVRAVIIEVKHGSDSTILYLREFTSREFVAIKLSDTCKREEIHAKTRISYHINKGFFGFLYTPDLNCKDLCIVECKKKS